MLSSFGWHKSASAGWNNLNSKGYKPGFDGFDFEFLAHFEQRAGWMDGDKKRL